MEALAEFLLDVDWWLQAIRILWSERKKERQYDQIKCVWEMEIILMETMIASFIEDCGRRTRDVMHAQEYNIHIHS